MLRHAVFLVPSADGILILPQMHTFQVALLDCERMKITQSDYDNSDWQIKQGLGEDSLSSNCTKLMSDSIFLRNQEHFEIQSFMFKDEAKPIELLSIANFGQQIVLTEISGNLFEVKP